MQRGLLVDRVGSCPCFGTFSGNDDVGPSDRARQGRVLGPGNGRQCLVG